MVSGITTDELQRMGGQLEVLGTSQGTLVELEGARPTGDQLVAPVPVLTPTGGFTEVVPADE